MEATLYRADGTQQVIEPKNCKNFTREELYKWLNCDTFELIYLGDENMIMLGDEEARCKNDYQVNEVATDIYRKSYGITDPQAHFDNWKKEAEEQNAFVIVDCADEPYNLVGNIIYCDTTMLR